MAVSLPMDNLRHHKDSTPTSPRAASEASTSACLSETSESGVGVYAQQELKDLHQLSLHSLAHLPNERPLAEIYQQLEWYFSDENLAYDPFFHKELSANGGMLDMNLILNCKMLRDLGTNEQLLRAALVGSDFRIACDGSAVGKPGKPLPPLLGSARDRPYKPAMAPLPLQRSRLETASASEIETASVPEMLEMVACRGVLLSSRHEQGCRVVQRLLAASDNRGRRAIFARLLGQMWTLAQCRYGNHVVQKCIECMPGAAKQIVQELMAWGPGGAKYLAMHPYGCRVFQRILEHGTPSDQECLLDDALWNASVLCTHKFANYVMQHVFEHCSVPAQRGRLVAAIANRAAHMCCSREGAAVIGKVFLYGTPSEQQEVATSLLRADGTWQTNRYARREKIIDALGRFQRQ